ncbi:ATP-binding cassette domain-containing protein [Streptococcus huangxiaojuni]|uniref:ATP-binding cassette domain-containing protein n=1 Tax=Streptococcus huangxiaojuni TaxID=3237239 RepID=UPI0034A4EEFA
MLQLNHLTIRHRRTNAVLVPDLTVSIQKGDKVALIGQEGVGKSTLLSYLFDPESIKEYADVHGQISYLSRHISYLPQQMPAADWRKDCFSYLYNPETDNVFDFNRCFQLANELGFASTHFDSPQTIGSLSGGERLKLQLIKLFLAPSDLLLLDEPANDLDLDSLEWLQNAIRQSQQTIIFISHDEHLLAKTANKIIHLEYHKKKKQALVHTKKCSYLDYMANRQRQFSKQNALAKKEQQERNKQLAKLRRSQSAVHHALNQTRNDIEGRLLAKKMKALKAQQKRFERENRQKEPVPYQTDTVHITFQKLQPLPAGKKILCYEHELLPLPQAGKTIPISLTVYGQDKIVITGRNGIGKTCLLKHIYQKLKEQRGALSIGYMPQNYDEIWDGQETALEFCGRRHQKEQVLTYLSSLQFNYEDIYRPVNKLSGGQKAKLLLAQMLLNQHNILLLDEPTRSFSPTSQKSIRQVLKAYPGCIISVSHDRSYISHVPKISYQLTEKGLIKK